MSNKVLNTSTLKIYDSLKELCLLKNMNYTYMSKKLSDKIPNNTNYIYVKELHFDKDVVFLDKNKNPFELLHYFELVDTYLMAVVKTIDKKVIVLEHEQIEKYPFEITKKELEIIKEFLLNKELNYLCKNFNTSPAVIDRIVLKYSNIDFNLIQ